MAFERDDREDDPNQRPSDRTQQERFDPWEDQFRREYQPSDREFDF